METEVTLTFSLPASIAQEVLAFVAARGYPRQNKQAATVGDLQTDLEARSDIFQPLTRGRASLADLLSGNLRKVAKFIVARKGRFYNDELAKEMGVDDPFTASFLGHITRKLRKVGIRAEGHRNQNWYTSNRAAGRTLIIVRADIVELLENEIS